MENSDKVSKHLNSYFAMDLLDFHSLHAYSSKIVFVWYLRLITFSDSLSQIHFEMKSKLESNINSHKVSIAIILSFWNSNIYYCSVKGFIHVSWALLETEFHIAPGKLLYRIKGRNLHYFLDDAPFTNTRKDSFNKCLPNYILKQWKYGAG